MQNVKKCQKKVQSMGTIRYRTSVFSFLYSESSYRNEKTDPIPKGWKLKCLARYFICTELREKQFTYIDLVFINLFGIFF